MTMWKSGCLKKYEFGLALSGGGTRGFVHIGALKFLDDLDLRPDLIAGTSAGSLAGVFYADGYGPDEIMDLFKASHMNHFVEWQMPKNSIFNFNGLRKFLKSNLRAKKFESLKIPLKVVVSDLGKGKYEVYEKGDLIEPVIASCSIPILLNPVLINGRYYVDGGLFKNFPVSLIKNMCEHVAGVNLCISPQVKKINSIPQIAEAVYNYIFSNNTSYDRSLCDILIEPKGILDYNMFDVEACVETFQLGYETAYRAFEDFAGKRKSHRKFWLR